MTPSTPIHDLGLVFKPLSSNIRAEGVTAHYGGESPWPGATTRNNPTAFRLSTDHDRCASILRAWHSYHLSKGWAGLAYSSGVCPHGHRYHGRGPGKRTGANGTNSGNLRSYAVVYIAGRSDPLTEAAAVAFLDEADRLGSVMRWDHSDWKPTECAGDAIRRWEATGWRRPGKAPIPGVSAPGPVLPPLPPVRQKVRGTYRKLDTGPAIWLLQGMLNATREYHGGPELATDGIFGPKTAAVLQRFERFAGVMQALAGNPVTITENGVAGRNELEALKWWTYAAQSK